MFTVIFRTSLILHKKLENILVIIINLYRNNGMCITQSTMIYTQCTSTCPTSRPHQQLEGGWGSHQKPRFKIPRLL